MNLVVFFTPRFLYLCVSVFVWLGGCSSLFLSLCVFLLVFVCICVLVVAFVLDAFVLSFFAYVLVKWQG